MRINCAGTHQEIVFSMNNLDYIMIAHGTTVIQLPHDNYIHESSINSSTEFSQSCWFAFNMRHILSTRHKTTSTGSEYLSFPIGLSSNLFLSIQMKNSNSYMRPIPLSLRLGELVRYLPSFTSMEVSHIQSGRVLLTSLS